MSEVSKDENKVSFKLKKIHIVIYIFSLLLISIIALAAIYFSKNNKHDDVHLHAGFMVVQDGKPVDFSNIIYMQIQPCGETHGDLTDEEKQIHKAHLHDLIGDVVHVHDEKVYWKDLFSNLSFEFKNTPVGYINDVKVDNILDQEIKAYDRVLIFDGEEGNISEFFKNIPTKNRIEEVEGMSESCSSSE